MATIRRACIPAFFPVALLALRAVVASAALGAGPPQWRLVRSGGGSSAAPKADAGTFRADFRYAPPWWQTSIGLPDDWQKTLVSKEGALLYDWPGKFSGFSTRVGIEIEGEEGDRTEQRLLDPRVPVVVSRRLRGDRELAHWQALAVVPGPDQELPRRARGAAAGLAIEATSRPSLQRDWGKPAVPCSPVFRSIEAGFDGPIGHRFRAEPGKRYEVAFGLLESYHAAPGKRIVELVVEGEVARRVDLIGDLGRHRPGVFTRPARDRDGDGYVSLSVRAAAASEDHYPILNALWVFPAGAAPSASDLVLGKTGPNLLGELDCGARDPTRAGPPRGDVILVEKRPGAGAIRVVLDSAQPLEPEEAGRGVQRAGRRFASFTERWKRVERRQSGVTLVFAPELASLGVYCASGFEAGDPTLEWARRQPGRAAAWWQRRDFPYGRISVPDTGIQSLIDSSIRNIYQAREVRAGRPVFQVGPTCYRGLWIVDGAFILEAMTYLDRVEEVRAGIEHLLGRAKPDGSFELLRNYWKENGIVLYLLNRHSLLTQDPEWLEARWKHVRALVRTIRELRERSRADPKAPEAGLMPPGFPDGGIGGVRSEYTNVYWNLVGLRQAVEAARRLAGHEEEARRWGREYDDFWKTFRAAAARDARKAADGSIYLPILMRGAEKVHPVRGQWSFCHAVFPGRLFERDDPLAEGNLALLDSRLSEGMVYGTGWMADGIWNYFASFWGHAHLWMGHGRRAAEILYAFARHASPLLAWREEQPPSGKGEGLVGDMPHNWASAEFIRLTRNLLVLERGTELHLLEGLPPAWLAPGARTALEGVRTDFGRIDLSLSVDGSGKSARLRVRAPGARPPERVVIHLGPWAAPGAEISPGAAGEAVVEIPLAGDQRG